MKKSMIALLILSLVLNVLLGAFAWCWVAAKEKHEAELCQNFVHACFNISTRLRQAIKQEQRSYVIFAATQLLELDGRLSTTYVWRDLDVHVPCKKNTPVSLLECLAEVLATGAEPIGRRDDSETFTPEELEKLQCLADGLERAALLFYNGLADENNYIGAELFYDDAAALQRALNELQQVTQPVFD